MALLSLRDGFCTGFAGCISGCQSPGAGCALSDVGEALVTAHQEVRGDPVRDIGWDRQEADLAHPTPTPQVTPSRLLCPLHASGSMSREHPGSTTLGRSSSSPCTATAT